MISLLEQLIIWGKDLKILYVEDDIYLREEITILLSDLFDVIDTAENGKQGLEKIADGSYDLVITDIKMPVMNGIEMIEKLKHEGSKLPVIVFSAHNESEFLFKLINLGIENFVTKPINGEQIFEVLHKVIKNIRDQNELKRYKKELEFANEKLKQTIDRQSKNINFKTSILRSYKDAVYNVALVSISTPEGEIKDVNDNFCTAFGFTKDEIIGKHQNYFIHPDSDMATCDDIKENIHEKKVWQGVTMSQKKTLEPLYHYTTVVPILNDKNDIYEILTIKQDLTELELANQDILSKSIERSIDVKHDDILNMLPFPSVLFDTSTKITHHNRALENFVSDLEDTDCFTLLMQNNLYIRDILDLDSSFPITETFFIETLCEINNVTGFNANAKTAKGSIDVFLKIKRLEDSLYVGSLVSKEDLEPCFLAQEN